MSSTNGMGPIPDDDTIPIQISDTVTRHGQADLPGDSVPAHRETGGDAIANGFVYRGKLIPRSGTSSCSATSPPADLGTPIVPTCSRPTTATRRPSRRFTRWTPACADSVEETYRERGGKGEALPGMGADLRPWPRGPAVRRRQRRRALHPDQERRHDQEGRRRGDRPRPRPRRSPTAAPVQLRTSARSQPRASEESRGVHARVDRRREAGLRPQLRRLSRQPGAGRGEGRHRRSRSSRSRGASSRRTSPTPNGITARATARSSLSSSAGCRRR